MAKENRISIPIAPHELPTAVRVVSEVVAGWLRDQGTGMQATIEALDDRVVVTVPKPAGAQIQISAGEEQVSLVFEGTDAVPADVMTRIDKRLTHLTATAWQLNLPSLSAPRLALNRPGAAAILLRLRGALPNPLRDIARSVKQDPATIDATAELLVACGLAEIRELDRSGRIRSLDLTMPGAELIGATNRLFPHPAERPHLAEAALRSLDACNWPLLQSILATGDAGIERSLLDDRVAIVDHLNANPEAGGPLVNVHPAELDAMLDCGILAERDGRVYVTAAGRAFLAEATKVDHDSELPGIGGTWEALHDADEATYRLALARANHAVALAGDLDPGEAADAYVEACEMISGAVTQIECPDLAHRALDLLVTTARSAATYDHQRWAPLADWAVCAAVLRLGGLGRWSDAAAMTEALIEISHGATASGAIATEWAERAHGAMVRAAASGRMPTDWTQIRDRLATVAAAASQQLEASSDAAELA